MATSGGKHALLAGKIGITAAKIGITYPFKAVALLSP